MRRAIDVANYTAVPTPEQVACLLAEGYDTAIVGASFGSVARPQLVQFSTSGMAIEAYAWVRFSGWWENLLDRALGAIAGLPVRRLWLDCEEETAMEPRTVIRRIEKAEAYVAEARPDLEIGINTGAWWWADFTANTEAFAHLPLWSAYYDNEPDIDFAQLPYGGWRAPAIEQYQGTVETCGLNTDRNVINEEEEMVDAPTKGEFVALARWHHDIFRTLTTALLDLATQVYGDADPKTRDLKQRLDELETAAALEEPSG